MSVERVRPPRLRDGAARRAIAHWRRESARIALLAAQDRPPVALRGQAFALQRECERLAAALRALGCAGARTGASVRPVAGGEGAER